MTVPRTEVTLLAIDDDPKSLELIQDGLAREELTILTAQDPEAGLELALRRRPEIVLLDLVMPGMNGIEVLERILQAAPSTEVILITGCYSAESAVDAIRKGAADYLTKPLSLAQLRERIGGLIAEYERRQRALQLDGELLKTCRFEGMVGRSPLMLEVFARIRRAAPHFKTALITGATGTGKELVALALHQLSPVSSARFAVCNSSAIVETLFESELFGHVKGAFTGAAQDKAGLFEYASGGTVFLDEIGDLPLATQTKLLRVLETREFQRVGSPAPRKADVRVIAATNRDLREMVEQKLFREDLFYRLSMLEIHLPRLADRKEDLPLLERHFIERFAAEYLKSIRGITQRGQTVLHRYSWPGNVRELENVLGHACMMCEGDLIDVHDFPDNLVSPAHAGKSGDEDLCPMAEVHRRHALRVLAAVQGNKAEAARILGIHRATLYRLVEGMEADAASQG
jgi:DNA-binding NtrC family response regulator